MEPVTMIVTALIAGALAASKDVGGEMLKDAYHGVKDLIKRKLSDSPLGQAAVDEVSDKTMPDSSTANVVKDKLKEAKADDDAELIEKAKALLEMLKQHGVQTQETYSAVLTGSGAIAQGPGARAVGERGVYVDGTAGNINTGTLNDGKAQDKG